MRIFLIGFMGSGKTSFGKRLAKRLNLDFFDLDEIIEEQFKISIPSIFSQFDEFVFRNLETQSLISIVEKDNFVLSCGGGTPCFNSNIDIINNSGISIYLKMNEKALASRLRESPKKRPLLYNLSGEELINRIAELLKQREVFYNKAKIIVEGLNLDIDKIYILLNNIK